MAISDNQLKYLKDTLAKAQASGNTGLAKWATSQINSAGASPSGNAGGAPAQSYSVPYSSINDADSLQNMYNDAQSKGANSATLNAISSRLNQLKGTTKQTTTPGDVTPKSYSYLPSSNNGSTPVATTPVNNSVAGRFTQYMQGFKPSTTQEDYMANARKIAEGNASLQYDAVAEDLKQKVANIIAKNQTRMSNLDNEYKPQLDANQEAENDALMEVKRILAKRGMLGSGVEIGNTKQTLNNYSKSEQQILANEEAARKELMDMNTQAEIDLNSALISNSSQKNAYIAQQEAQAIKDYEDKIFKEKAFEAENFWKGSDYDVKQQEMAQQASQFDRTIALDEAKLTESKNQFAKTYGLEEKKFKESQDQYDETMGFNRDQLAQEWKIASAQMSQQLTIAGWENDRAKENYQLSKDKYNQEIEEYTAKQNDTDREYIMAENNRIDALIMKSIDMVNAGTMTQDQFSKAVGGIINTSALSSKEKTAKVAQVMDAFKITPTTSTTPTKNTSAQTYQDQKKADQNQVKYTALIKKYGDGYISSYGSKGVDKALNMLDQNAWALTLVGGGNFPNDVKNYVYYTMTQKKKK